MSTDDENGIVILIGILCAICLVLGFWMAKP